MRSLHSLLTMAFVCLFFQLNLQAQNDNTEYVIVEYMKVKPGMWEKYLECEKAWKEVHQYRLKQGLITGWELEEVLFPSGTNAEYDFLVVTHYKNWKAMQSEVNWYEPAMKTLSADRRAVADKADDYRDLIKREVWAAGDVVFAPGKTQPKYRVENFMKIPSGGWDAWVEMESKFVKPVHEKNIAMGNRAGWVLGFMILPRGESGEYDASTVDFYNTWEDMDKNEGKAWKEVYPDLSQGDIGRRIEGTRKLVRTEVRVLVDSVQ